MVIAYSKKVDGNKYVEKNFKVKEFACRDGSDKVLVCDETVRILQAVRDYFGRPVTINSAYRTPTYNKKIGGASKSQHVVGTACDISVKGVPPSAVASFLEAFYPKHGIGLYPTFVHIDSRGYKVYWLNKGNNVVSSFAKGNLHLQYKAQQPVEQPIAQQEETEVTEQRVIEIIQSYFDNNGKVSEWAEADVNEAVKLGITSGDQPQRFATRQEVIVMIMRAIRILKGG